MIKNISDFRAFFIIFFAPFILYFPFSFGEEILQLESVNTAPLGTDIHSTHIIQTIERLEQLKQTVLFELHPSFTDPPSSDFDFLFPKNEDASFPLQKTSDPYMKEQLIVSNGANITPKFKEIFLLLSDEARLKACKKIYSETPQEFVQQILHYLTRGTPEQALIINQILPYLKQELEEPLITLLQEESLNLSEKRAVIYTLGRIKSEKAIPLFWNEIQTTTSDEIQYTCVQALSNMPHTIPLEQWVQLLQYDSIPISMISAHAIVEYGGSYAEEYIRRILLGEFRVSQRVMEYLVSRVSNYPVEILVPFSIEVMSRNPNLAPKLAGILHQKTGVNLGPNPPLWSNWWKEYLNNTSRAENPESSDATKDNALQQPDVKVHQPKIRKR